MIITFVRHAQSEANILQNLDIKDSQLTKLGIEQSKKLQGHFDIVLCSPLRRTRDTLANSQITYDKLISVPEARECRWSISDFLEDDKESDDYRETEEEIAERSRKFYKTLLSVAASGEKKVLVVSHLNFLFDFTDRFCPKAMKLENATMAEIDITF